MFNKIKSFKNKSLIFLKGINVLNQMCFIYSKKDKTKQIYYLNLYFTQGPLINSYDRDPS